MVRQVRAQRGFSLQRDVLELGLVPLVIHFLGLLGFKLSSSSLFARHCLLDGNTVGALNLLKGGRLIPSALIELLLLFVLLFLHLLSDNFVVGIAALLVALLENIFKLL